MAGAAAAPAKFHYNWLIYCSPITKPASFGLEPAVAYVGVVLLSLTCGIVSFVSVLGVLGGWPGTTSSSGETSRLGTFAAPDLAPEGVTSLAVLRPIPVTIGADETIAAASQLTLTIGSAAPARGSPHPNGVLVPPMARRAPAEPVLTMDETPSLQPSVVVAKAPSAPVPAPRLAVRKPFAPEVRSALGGPLPAAKPTTPSLAAKVRASTSAKSIVPGPAP